MFWLFRPTAPSPRAQAIQTIHMAHAMACLGYEITMAVNPAHGKCVTVENILKYYGLEPVPGLNLKVLPVGGTLASAAFRVLFARWVTRNKGGTVLARSKKYAAQAIPLIADRCRLVIEAHEVDSLQLAERGEDPSSVRALEKRVFAAADAVVANAPGTLHLLREAHDLPPSVALHNGTHPDRRRTRRSAGEGVGYIGSLRAYKDLRTLACASKQLDMNIVCVTGDAETKEAEQLRTLSEGCLIFEPAVPYRAVPDRMIEFKMLVIPLQDGLFGRYLTSPLKLWDGLASGIPMVGADLPSLHDAAGNGFEPYTPECVSSLCSALKRVDQDEALRERLTKATRLRTWSDRAVELESFLGDVL